MLSRLATFLQKIFSHKTHPNTLWLLAIFMWAECAHASTNSTLILTASGPNVRVQWQRSTSGPVTAYEASIFGPGVGSTANSGDITVAVGSGTHTYTFSERVTYYGTTTEQSSITRSITISGQGLAPATVSVNSTALLCTDNQVTLNWSSVTTSRYAVESRSRSIGGSWPTGWNRITQNVSALSYTVSPLTDGREYEFRVSAASTSPGGEYLMWRNSPVVRKAACPSTASSETPFVAESSLVTATEITATDNIGVIGGQFRVNESGAATYSIPIVVPPGTAGVTPELALSYSSQSGNGLVGRGWNLEGLGAISRCRQTLMQDRQALPISWGINDRFCLNGTRLVLVQSSPDLVYKTEVDSFVKVIAKGGTPGKPDYFLMEAKDGSVTRFGASGDAPSETKVFDASGNPQTDKVLNWNISQFQDSAENKIDFFYTATRDHHRIDRIEYAFGSSTTAGASVDFEYEARQDQIRGFIAGYRISNISRLKRVISKNGTEEVRRYVLNYGVVGSTATASKVSRVISIDECVGTTNCLPRTNFTWSGYGPNLNSNAKAPDHSIDVGSSNIVAADFADIDGDGVLEPVWVGNSNLRYQIGGTNYSASGSGTVIGDAKPILKVVDYNLDGRDDVLVYDSTSTTKWRLFLSTPQATVGSNGKVQWRLQRANITLPFAEPHTHFIDFNSDGILDAYTFYQTPNSPGSVRLYRGERSGQSVNSNLFYRFSATPIDVPVPNAGSLWETNFVWGDFNGDGRADIAHSNIEWLPQFQVIGKGINILYSTATGGFTHAVTLAQNSVVHSLRALDINSDGLTDIFYRIGTSDWYYQLNNGTGFDPQTKIAESFADEGAQFADLNNDGYPDVFWRSGSQILYKVWLTETQRFSTTGTYIANVPWGTDPGISYGFRDLDNNGALDLIATAGGVNFAGGGRGIRTRHSNTGGQFIGLIVNGLGAETRIEYSPLNGLVDPKLYNTYDGIQVTEGTREVCEGGYAIPVSSGGYVPRVCRQETAYSVDSSEFYRQVNDPYAYLPEGTQILRPENVSPVQELKGGYTVVASVHSSSPMISDPNFKAGIKYRYGVNLFQAAGRGSLGFRELITEDLQSGIVTRSSYRQDWPFIGQPLSTAAFTSIGMSPKLTESFTQTEIFGYTADMAQTLTHSGSAALQSIQIYAPRTIDLEYHLLQDGFYQGEWILDTTTTLTPDAFGNVRQTEVIKKDRKGNYYRQHTNNSYGSSDWYREKGRLTGSVVTHERYSADENASDTVVREAQFTYYESGRQNGLLKTEISNANDNLGKTSTTHFYDDFGNKVFSTVTGGDGVRRISSNTVYDSRGRYPDKTFGLFNFAISASDDSGSSPNYTTQRTNQVGTSTATIQLTSSVVSRHSLGLPTQTTNYTGTTTTITTKAAYTPFGNQYFATDASGSYSLTTASVGPGYHCPFITAFHTRTRVAGGGEMVTCNDKLGREIRKARNSFQGDWLYVDTEYDAQGRIQRLSEPSKSSPSFWTTFEYDLLGRAVMVLHPDGSQTQTHYGYLDKTIINDQYQNRSEQYNAAGDLIRASDDYGYKIYYVYSGDGQLKKMTGPSSYPTTIEYDAIGRKIRMNDPDKGNWKYKYNSQGELICQQDAKGQTIITNYDFAGRVIERVDRAAGGTCDNPTGAIQHRAVWKFDTAARGMGKTALEWSGSSSATESNPDYRKILTYDTLGRPSTVRTTLRGHNDVLGDHWEKIAYDQFSRPWKTWDAARGSESFSQNGVENVYDAYGYPYLVRDAHTSAKYYEAKAVDERGNVTRDELGDGVVRRQADYYLDTGHIERFTAWDLQNRKIQALYLEWDTIGNLQMRQETGINKSGASRNLWENFGYDDLNRLTDYTVVSGASTSITVQYDKTGNITRKSDVGDYNYNTNGVRPHAVSQAGSYSYSYDINGSLTSDTRGRAFTYSAADQATRVTKSGRSTDFFYDANRGRYKRIDTTGSAKTTTLYLGSVEKVHHSDNTQEWRRYIHDGIMITQLFNASGSQTANKIQFILKDHLGSPSVITDESGIIKELMAFDPWGKRRAEADWTPLSLTAIQSNWFVSTKPETSRGFTGHQMADEMEIIHMNGRIYDPLLGRFLQADPFIQAPNTTASLNRYSYVMNNPLNATDPSGFWSLSKFLKKAWNAVRPFVGMIVATVLTIYAPQGAGFWYATFVGAAAGAAGAAANGGNILKGAVIGAISAAAFYGVGTAFDGAAGGGDFFGTNLSPGDFAAKALAHGITGGVMSVLQGGKFGHGFVSAGISQGFAGKINGMGSQTARVIASGVLGGTSSKLTGGKFANGATTAAFGRLFNEEMHKQSKCSGQMCRSEGKRGNDHISGAATDFVDNYADMREANTIGADKYFHCKANCEASQRGTTGARTAEVISNAREWSDQNIKGDSPAASMDDQRANMYGRQQGITNPSADCKVLCSPFRPNGLDLKY